MKASQTIAVLGPLGPAQLVCLHSWRRLGFLTLFLHTDPVPLAKPFRRIADQYVHAPWNGSPTANGFAKIADALATAHCTQLVSVADALALACWGHLPTLVPQVQLLLCPAPVIDFLESKVAQAEKATAVGFNVLPTALVPADSGSAAASVKFPIVIRPDRASRDSSFKAKLLDTPKALEAFLASRSANAPKVLAQPFISGPNAVVHGAARSTGELLPLRGYLAAIKHEGVTVTLTPWKLPPAVEEACKAFARAAAVVGVFHFDLLVDPADGRVWFLEMNARLGGTTAKVYASGLDEPHALLWAHGIVDSVPQIDSRLKSVVNRMAAVKCMKRALRGDGDPIDFPFPNRSKVFWGALFAAVRYRDEVLSIRHPDIALPFLSRVGR